MRERHNIVGSEVGHPRPPAYLRAPPKIKRAGLALYWLLVVLSLGALLLTILLIT